MKKLFLIFSALLLIFFACSKENELKKSVFVYDEEFIDLPAYSEWGYNTFGAYYDRTPFVSNNTIVPAKVIVQNNEMSFVLAGPKQSENYYSNSEMTMTFKMPGFAPADYTGLVKLNDTLIDLSKQEYQVLVSIDTSHYTATILSGELKFKRAQNLLVDKKQIEVILSGYFEFKALINNKPITVSDGRFDVGISSDNFYRY
ncbi:MAG: hypothetical protein Q7U54_10635 [Bacteroidales bacterium]|nr:hypothetical protein [Bacteroidales bacterium]